MKPSTTYVGLDVHKSTISVAVTDEGRCGEVRNHGVVENRADLLIRLAERLSRRADFPLRSSSQTSTARGFRGAWRLTARRRGHYVLGSHVFMVGKMLLRVAAQSGGTKQERDNNFDTIRLLAALSVLVSHAFPLSYGRAAWQPLQLLTRQQTNLGLTAVFVFFIISGWLITESFSRNSPEQYAMARALRILPGLTVVLLALVFLIGPALTTVPLRDYFGSAQTYSFLCKNLSLTSFVDGLPGVFDSNPFPHAVNGSLWTLRYEAECYGIVYILGRCGLLHRYVMTALLFACLLASWRYIGGWRLEFYSCFAAGAALCVWSRHYPHRQLLQGRFALIATLIWAASFYMGFRVASATFGAYIVLYLGLAPTIRLPKVKRWGDLSYGTYVWAWPIQQTVTSALGAWASWWLNITLSLPLTLAFAALSWRYIEGPALALKRPRLSSDRVVVPQGGGGL